MMIRLQVLKKLVFSSSAGVSSVVSSPTSSVSCVEGVGSGVSVLLSSCGVEGVFGFDSVVVFGVFAFAESRSCLPDEESVVELLGVLEL